MEKLKALIDDVKKHKEKFEKPHSKLIISKNYFEEMMKEAPHKDNTQMISISLPFKNMEVSEELQEGYQIIE